MWFNCVISCCFPLLIFGQEVSLVKTAVQEGQTGHWEVQLDFEVDKGFHIQESEPELSWLIPTVIEIDQSGGCTVAGVDYPVPHEFEMTSGDRFKVISGVFRIVLKVQCREPDMERLIAVLSYQSCDAMKCYFPRTLAVEVLLKP